MAARVAAKLRSERDVGIETVRGGLGEFTVFIDGRAAVRASRFWYPHPARVVREVLARLREI